MARSRRQDKSAPAHLTGTQCANTSLTCGNRQGESAYLEALLSQFAIALEHHEMPFTRH